MLFVGIINGRVRGMYLTRDQKDQLRMGVDKCMDWMDPVVHPNQYNVKFHLVEAVQEKDYDFYVVGQCTSLYRISCWILTISRMVKEI